MKLIFHKPEVVEESTGSNKDDLKRIAELEAKLEARKKSERERALEIIRYHEKAKEEV